MGAERGGEHIKYLPLPRIFWKEKSKLEEGGSTPKIKIKNAQYLSEIILP
jgi:hypothetical protein